MPRNIHTSDNFRKGLLGRKTTCVLIICALILHFENICFANERLNNIDSFDYYRNLALEDYASIDSNLNFLEKAKSFLSCDSILLSNYHYLRGNILFFKNNFDGSEKELQKSLGFLGNNYEVNQDYFNVINSLSLIYQKQGKLLESESLLEEIVAKFDFKNPTENTIIILNNLAKVKIINQDYFGGLEILKFVIKFIENQKVPNRNSIANTLLYIAECELNLSKYKEALLTIQEGIKYSKIHITNSNPLKEEITAQFYLKLTKLYLIQGNYFLAKKVLFKQLNEVIISKIPNNFLIRFEISLLKAQILYSEGNLLFAKNSLNKLLNDFPEGFKKYKLRAIILLGKVNLSLGNYNDPLFENFIVENQLQKIKPENISQSYSLLSDRNWIDFFFIWGKILDKCNQINSQSKLKIAILLNLKQQLRTKNKKSNSIIFSNRRNIIEYYIKKHLSKNSSLNIGEIFFAFETNKGLSLLEDLNLGILETSEQLSHYEALNEAKKDLLRFNRQNGQLKDGEYFNLKNRLNYQLSITKKNSPFFDDIISSFTSLKEKISTLPLQKEQVLIEIFEGTDEVFVMGITNKKQLTFSICKEELLFDSLGLLEFQSLKNNPIKGSRISFNLFEKLIKPFINQDTKEIIFIPDGKLTSIPIETLVTNKKSPNSYLIKSYSVSYNYSVQLWLKSQEKKYVRNSIYDFAGFAPEFSGPISQNYRDCNESIQSTLICNQAEVSESNKIFNGTRNYLNKRATISNFQGANNISKILHLATHSCFDENNPSFSKIYFSDGYLIKDELSMLEINNELTVLSACNTGNGAYWEGEGIMSLAKGFFQAGSRSLLTAQWSIDDCVTPIIIEKYYRHLKNGERKDRALQLAKIEFIEDNPGIKSHPYFWAGLVQFGDCSPIEFSKSPMEKSIPYALAIIPIGLGLWYRQRRKKAA